MMYHLLMFPLLLFLFIVAHLCWCLRLLHSNLKVEKRFVFFSCRSEARTITSLDRVRIWVFLTEIILKKTKLYFKRVTLDCFKNTGKSVGLQASPSNRRHFSGRIWICEYIRTSMWDHLLVSNHLPQATANPQHQNFPVKALQLEPLVISDHLL